MSLRSKMLAMSTIPVVVLIFAVVYSVSARLAESRTNTEVDRANTVRQLLAEIQNDLGVAESSVRGFLLTERAGMRTDYEEAVIELSSDLADARLPSPRTSFKASGSSDSRSSSTSGWRLSGAACVPGPRGRPDHDRLVTLLLHGQTITDALRGLTEQMRLTADELVAQQIAARDASFERSFLVQVIAMPAAIVRAMILMVGFTASIVRRVGKIRRNAKRLDEGRPLDDPDSSQDELGSLSRALVRTGSHLSELQEELRRLATVDELTSSPTGEGSSRSASTNSWSRRGPSRPSPCCSSTWTVSRT